MVRHVISWKDWEGKELTEMIDLGLDMKQNPEKYNQALKDKTLIMLFEKTSTRTRLSFEIGMTKLGGHGIFFDWQKSNIGVTEANLEAAVMSRYADFVMARLKKNETLVKLAKGATVPLINALDEKYHPCQGLADYMTVKEKAGDFSKARMIYVGIANNVSNSLMSAGTKLGCEVVLVTPEKDPDAIDEELEKQAKETGLYHEVETVKEALETEKKCFVYTDTWINLEWFNNPDFKEEKDRRLKSFMPVQLNKKMIEGYDPYVMHCMPIHLGYEFGEDVLPENYEKTIIYDQAENRMWAQMGLLVWLNRN
ncbi:MAG: ornithine carbamoyltransferase [Candidatus Hodarchaeales archaeon]|jgi:ornithine carbamoyltransferase